MSHQHHTIDYIEFTVTDMAQAKEFYSSVFGWTFNEYGPGYAGIRKDGGGEVGGFAHGEPISGAGPLVVLYSQNLEATQEAVLGAGGKLVQETFEFPGGKRFHFRDPSGNVLAVAHYNES